jgi:hypothetical protein
MAETEDPEELENAAAVGPYLDIHLQDAKKIVITKISDTNPPQYLAVLTIDNPVIDDGVA